MSEKGYEILGLTMFMFAGVGVYTVAKEIKDAYYKHKLIKGGEAMVAIGERLCEIKSAKVEENEELEVQ